MVTITKYRYVFLLTILVCWPLHGTENVDREEELREEYDACATSPESAHLYLLGLMNKKLTAMVEAYQAEQSDDDLALSVMMLYIDFNHIRCAIHSGHPLFPSINFMDYCFYVLKYGAVSKDLQQMPDELRNNFIDGLTDFCAHLCSYDVDSFVSTIQSGLQDHFTPKIETN